MIYKIRDHWNPKNIIEWDFPEPPVPGYVFEHDNVEYRVIRTIQLIGKLPVIFVRMFRYKIANTSTTFVHKCPAKKNASQKLSRDDQIKLEEKHGKAKLAKILNERVKIRSIGAQVQFKCPFCATTFWKEQFELPETVQVDGVMNKKKLKKR